MIDVQFPRKLDFLFEPHRYKIAYGGRGGAKSWGFARALLIKGLEKPLRIFCGREIQKSIQDSVHKLLADQIELLRMYNYEVQNATILGKNGTQFIFAGLKHNISNIKSLESVDIAWIEEAHSVSKASWEVLIPTIRKAGSEIWISMNPELEDDDSYQRFVVHPPTNSKVVKIGWQDNKWLSNELKQEKDDLKIRDPAAYLNVWEGECKQAIEGAIFARQLQRAAEEGRIREVPYDSTKPVNTYWDLGRSDHTSIWFCQYVGMQWRILKNYSNSLQDMAHYLKYVQNQPYLYGMHYLPHDAEQERLGMDKSIEEQAREILKNVFVVPRVQHKGNSIEAAKTVFSLCVFDKEGCADGLSDLRRYSYDIDPQTGKIGKSPKHDIYSDTADAFQCFAMACHLDVPDNYDVQQKELKSEFPARFRPTFQSPLADFGIEDNSHNDPYSAY